MQEIRGLDTEALMDMLARETANYTRMQTEGCEEEDFIRTSLKIRAIQAEIENRKTRVVNMRDAAEPRLDAS